MTEMALDERQALVRLAMLSDIGGGRLASILATWSSGHASPTEVLGSLSSKPHPVLGGDVVRTDSWAHQCADRSAAEAWHDLERDGIGVTVVGEDGHPSDVLDDPHVPPVLFWAGHCGVGDRRLVGIVGTRRMSRYGHDIATRLGHELADLGIGVVSGLALGIDGAAHEGCLRGADPRPIAVVGSGPDVLYPRRHRRLWEEVKGVGSVLSEYPPGTPPAPWRFPARNRILAALSEALVVVESAERGGSLITAGLAAERGVPVLAVPGSIHSRSSVGCHRLIADGAAPYIDIDDVLDSLGMARPAGVGPAAAPGSSSDLSEEERLVWDTLGEEPLSVDEIAAVSELTIPTLLAAVSRLEAANRVWVSESEVRRRHA